MNYRLLSDMYFYKYFLTVSGLSFDFLNIVFHRVVLFYFNDIQVIKQFFMDCTFGILLKKLSLYLRSFKFYPQLLYFSNLKFLIEPCLYLFLCGDFLFLCWCFLSFSLKHFFFNGCFNLCQIISTSLSFQCYHLFISFVIQFEIYLVFGVISDFWLKYEHFHICYESLDFIYTFGFRGVSLTILYQEKGALLPSYCWVEVETHVPYLFPFTPCNSWVGLRVLALCKLLC